MLRFSGRGAVGTNPQGGIVLIAAIVGYADAVIVHGQETVVVVQANELSGLGAEAGTDQR